MIREFFKNYWGWLPVIAIIGFLTYCNHNSHEEKYYGTVIEVGNCASPSGDAPECVARVQLDRGGQYIIKFSSPVMLNQRIVKDCTFYPNAPNWVASHSCSWY